MFWSNESSFMLPRVRNAATGADELAAEAAYELAAVESAEPFTALVLSWNAAAPSGSSIVFEARVRYASADEQPEAGAWSDWRVLGHWGGPTPRSKAGNQRGDDPISVATDILQLDKGYEASAFGLRLTLRRGEGEAPLVRRLAVSTRAGVVSEDEDTATKGEAVRHAVPPRSQHAEDPAIENEICSPTSLGMVMAFYGVDQPTAKVAAGVFDHEAAIYGNWPFNTAYAGSHGLNAAVRHFRSMRELEAEVRAGRPVIASIAFEAGEFPESPTRRTNGHLIVVTGVTEDGDFYVNDPDANPVLDQPIERIYSRANLRRAWLSHGGVAYVVSET